LDVQPMEKRLQDFATVTQGSRIDRYHEDEVVGLLLHHSHV
jgi:hypothetical protein